jgi:ketosteroid isomerase-like protein
MQPSSPQKCRQLRETLLEDAFLLCDADAVARLFEDGSLLVTGGGSQQVRGREAILQAASLLCNHGCGYLADPRRVFQSRDTALLIGEGVINVARRGQDGLWRFAITMLGS